MRLLMELNRPGGIDFDSCANIIRTDAALTYRILRQVQKLVYYRGNLITAIRQALVIMGSDEVRRWILLVVARDNNMTHSDEMVRQAYLRGCFAKRLMAKCRAREDTECGFLLGMFSMLDKILNIPMEDLLNEIELPRQISQALLGEADNFYSRLLQYILIYESGNRNLVLPDIGITLSEREISRLYMSSVLETDSIFNETEGTA
jgi:EAL and modified HD-GYP domain-containing signal transduction protein